MKRPTITKAIIENAKKTLIDAIRPHVLAANNQLDFDQMQVCVLEPGGNSLDYDDNVIAVDGLIMENGIIKTHGTYMSDGETLQEAEPVELHDLTCEEIAAILDTTILTTQ